MIVKEKGKRKNGKVWTSLLFHFSLFIFHFSLFAGHPSLTSEKDYVDEFFEIPSKFVDDLAVIPGDADFYQVLTIERVGKWNVYTNGLWALTNEFVLANGYEARPYPSEFYRDVFKKYHVQLDASQSMMKLNLGSHLEGVGMAWSPNMFDFSFPADPRLSTLVRFCYNGGGGTTYSLRYLTGLGDLYHPRSFRLDNHTYMALLTSYAAYFERLYYASEGQTNAWDGAGRWGDYGPSDKFVFSLTNSEYSARNCYFDWPVGANGRRAVEDCRKLKEWARNRDLRAEIRDDMFRREIVGESDDKPVNPDFVYRPGWLLDREMSPYPYGQNPARGGLWWTSQADPPAWDDGPSQQATTSGFHFFPEFEWTENPVSVNGSPNLDWSDYCVTFNMARVQDRDADPTHPLAELFKRVGYFSGPDGWHVDAIIRPYRFMSATGSGFGLYEWMTNAYPRCVSQYYDKTLAFEGYRERCWGIYGEDPSRRLLPNDYVGINQVLGAMDRTLHIPDLAVTSTNRITSVARRGDYDAGGEFQLTLVYDGYAPPIPRVVETPVRGVIMALDSVTNEVSSRVANVGTDGIYVAADKPDVDLSGRGAYVPVTNVIALLGHDLVGKLDGEGTIRIVSVQHSMYWWALNVGFVETNDVTQATNYFERVTSMFVYRPGETNVMFRPRAVASRSYTYERPEVIVPRLGPTQPGKSAGDRCSSSQYGMLSSDSIFYYNLTNASWTTADLYKAGKAVEYRDRSSLERAVADSLKTQSDEMFNLIPTYQQDDPTGPTPDDPEGYAPLPYTIKPVDIYPRSATVLDGKAEPTLDLNATSPTTNSWYTYWFNVESNRLDRTYSVEERNEVFLYHNKKYYITNYVASGVLETNKVEDIADTYEFYHSSLTNLTSETVTRGLTTVKVGLLPPWADNNIELTNFVETVDHFDVYGWVATNTYPRSIEHITFMSGTGPDDPGRDTGTYDWIITGEGSYDVVPYSRTDKVSLGVRSVPTAYELTDAFHVESTNVLLQAFGVYLDYVINGEMIVDVRPYRLWVNLLTGEVMREDLPFPLVVGVLGIDLDIECDYDFGDVYFGGPAHEIEMRGDGKIITQTDWQWKNLKRTDQ